MMKFDTLTINQPTLDALADRVIFTEIPGEPLRVLNGTPVMVSPYLRDGVVLYWFQNKLVGVISPEDICE